MSAKAGSLIQPTLCVLLSADYVSQGRQSVFSLIQPTLCVLLSADYVSQGRQSVFSLIQRTLCVLLSADYVSQGSQQYCDVIMMFTAEHFKNCKYVLFICLTYHIYTYSSDEVNIACL